MNERKSSTMNIYYVHGYDERESVRLEDQAHCLNELLHNDSIFPKGSTILEAGCGVGAQTRIIAPKIRIQNLYQLIFPKSRYIKLNPLLIPSILRMLSFKLAIFSI